MVIVSSSLVNSAPFMVRRPEEKDARTRIWLEHGDTLLIDGLAQEGVRSAVPVLAGPRTNFMFQPAGTTPSKICPAFGQWCLLPSFTQGSSVLDLR